MTPAGLAESMVPVACDPLRGYTLADLNGLAAAVVARHRHWWPAGDIAGQHAAAWDGITEHLLTAGSPPSPAGLRAAGLRALAASVRRDISHQGGGSHNDIANAGAKFASYWEWHSRPAPDPQERVAERIAVPQILATLPPRQREALHALAAWEDYQLAAAAMGCTVGTFEVHIRRARMAFRALWHEGETPSRQWRKDKRVYSRTPREEEIPECGTLRGWWRHKRRKEDCPAGTCREAWNAWNRARYAEKKAA